MWLGTCAIMPLLAHPTFCRAKDIDVLTDETAARHTLSLLTSDPADGGFQHYVRVQAAKAAILPANISYAAGSVLPLAVDTAAVGLFSPTTENKGLGLAYPSLNPKHSNQVVVVWGGSSSVGALATQLTTAAGATVIATASSHNVRSTPSSSSSPNPNPRREV